MNENNLDNSLKLIAKSSFIVFIGLFLSKLFMYLYRAVIARYFGPEVYGLFSLTLMIISWFVVFAVFGINQGILRYIPLYRGKKEINKIKYLFKSFFFLLLLSSIFFGVLLFVFSEFISVNLFHNSNLTLFLKVFSITIPLTVLLQFFLYLILAFEKINWYSFIYNILQDFVKVFSIILLAFLGFGTNSIFFSYILGTFSAFFASYLVCRKYLKPVFGKYVLNEEKRHELFKEVISYSWPLLFSGIVATIFVWTDSFVIGFFMDVKHVGYYNSAIPIAMLLTVVSELFTKLFSPLITREYSRDGKNISLINQLSKQIGKWIFLFDLPLLFLMLIFPEQLISILFGSQYIPAQNSLRFLAIGMFFSSIFTVSQRLITMIGKSKILLIDTIIVAVINLILNIILVQKYGMSGAAFSTMFSLILLNLLFLFQAKKFLSIVPLKKKMMNIFLVLLIPTFFLIFIKLKMEISGYLSVFLVCSFFVLFYFLLIFLTSCLDKNDMMILKSISSKFKLR